MTKYEIVKALSKCKLSDVEFLSVVYHNPCDNQGDIIHYEFEYDSLYGRCPSEKNKFELLKVLQSIYKMRGYITYIACSCKSFDGKFYDNGNQFYILNSISEFIEFSK